jgi:hypothetical protein
MTSGHHPPSDPPRDRHPDDRAGHPDLDALADLDAGLPDPTSAARLTEHVAGCPACSDVLRALSAVRAELRALPPPELPPGVAARLDATVADLQAGEPPSTPDAAAVAAAAAQVGPARPPGEPGDRPAQAGDAASVVDLDAGRERRRERSRRITTLVAASAVVLATAVGVGTAVLRETHSGRTPTESAALPADRGAGQGTTYGGGSATGGTGGTTRVKPYGPDEREPQVLHPPGYTRSTLVGALPSIVASSAVQVVSAAGTRGPAGAMADASRRERCVSALPDASGQLAAVQLATFEGTNAFVLVFESSGGSRSVVVVADTCGAAAGSATVLYRWP